jgi:hypothetical protein
LLAWIRLSAVSDHAGTHLPHTWERPRDELPLGAWNTNPLLRRDGRRYGRAACDGVVSYPR